MELAIKEANGLSHNYVGTEHLLLALMGLGEGAAFNVLLALGVKVETTAQRFECVGLLKELSGIDSVFSSCLTRHSSANARRTISSRVGM